MKIENIHKKILQGICIWITVFLVASIILFVQKLSSKTITIGKTTISSSKVISTLLSVDKKDITMVIILVLFSILVLNPIKMYGILRVTGFKLSIKDTIVLYLSSIPIMNFAPGQRAASSAYLSYILYLYTGKSGDKATIYFLVENTITFFVMFLIILWITSSFGVPKHLESLWLTIKNLMIIGIGLYIFAIIFCEIYLIRREFKDERLEKAKQIYKMYKKAILRSLFNFKYFVLIYGVALVLYFTWYLELYFLLKAIKVSLPIETIAVCEAVVSLILLIPTTPGDLGTLEAAQMMVYHYKLGIPVEKIIAFYILNRGIIFLLPSILGLVMYYYVYLTKLKSVINKNTKA